MRATGRRGRAGYLCRQSGLEFDGTMTLWKGLMAMERRTVLNWILLGFGGGLLPNPLHAASPEHVRPLTEACHTLARARRAAGLSRLTLQPVLMLTADHHSMHMKALGQATHRDAFERNPDVRAARLGYEGRVLGEVLAETFGSPRETVHAWLANPATRSVLLDTEAREVGLAVAGDAGSRVWWTLVVGAF